MEFVQSYITDIETLLLHYPEAYNAFKTRNQISHYLDGGPMQMLRREMDIYKLRENGIFFTSKKIAKKLLMVEKHLDWNNTSAWDPCCGAGDLLLAVLASLQISTSLSETLRDWNERIFGNDREEKFVELTKLRIILLALTKGAKPNVDISTAKSYLENIRQADTISSGFSAPSANIVLLNPPYTKVPVQDTCTWASGRVSNAAIFLEVLMSKMKSGTKILAILPDVLRSGSRYEKWRELINKLGAPTKITTLGRFDSQTDVDVFLGKFVIGENNSSKPWWQNRKATAGLSTLSDLFDISVGPVVPYRDPEDGNEFLYLTAKDVLLWQATTPKKKRRYSGTVFSPPFVIVKRTSSPSDKYRAGAGVITGTRKVAIENHLLVLVPKDKTLQTCLNTLNILKDFTTNDWLNERIRCRHLTVSALKDLPCKK